MERASTSSLFNNASGLDNWIHLWSVIWGVLCKASGQLASFVRKQQVFEKVSIRSSESDCWLLVSNWNNYGLSFLEGMVLFR